VELITQSPSLAAALKETAVMYARLGYHVFPLAPGSKKPVKDSSGLLDATTHLTTIVEWWDKSPYGNIGIACGPSGWVVLDFDAGKPEYPAASEEMRLKLVRSHPTLTVRTRSGGYHMIYRQQPDSEPIHNSQDKLSLCVDVRGAGGYVVAPPSVVEGGKYTFEDKSPITVVPDWVVEQLRRPEPKKEITPNVNGSINHTVEWSKVEAAARSLSRYRASNGDAWLAVGMAIHDADSTERGWALFDEFSRQCPEKYNEHNNRTRWDSFTAGDGIEIGTLFWYANADSPDWFQRYWATQRATYQNGAAPVSVNGYHHEELIDPPTPEEPDYMRDQPQDFGLDQSIDPAAELAYQPNQETPAEPSAGVTVIFPRYSLLDLYNLPPKEWLITSFLGKRDLAMIYGPSGGGKTHVALDMIFAACLGLPFAAGKFATPAPLSIAYCAGEGTSGLPDRFRAVAEKYKVPGNLPGFVYVPLVPQLFDERAGGATIARFVAEQKAAQTAGAPALDLIVIDTMHAATIGFNENDATESGYVINSMKLAQKELECTILLIHHANKGGLQERGSTSIRAAMDTVVSVSPNGTPGRFQLQPEKMKDAEAWPKISFTLHKAERGTVYVDWEESPELAEGRGGQLTKREQIYNLLKGSSRTWHTAKRIEEATGIPQTKVNRELALLTEDRKIERRLQDADKDASNRNPWQYRYLAQ